MPLELLTRDAYYHDDRATSRLFFAVLRYSGGPHWYRTCDCLAEITRYVRHTWSPCATECGATLHTPLTSVHP